MNVVTPCVEMGEALTNGAKRRRNGSTKGGREKGSRGPRRTKGKKTGDEERRGRGGGREVRGKRPSQHFVRIRLFACARRGRIRGG